MVDRVRIGIVGLGNNTRKRHVPGFLARQNVELVAVCNRHAASTRRAAEEFGIPKTYDNWEGLVEDPDVEAVVIGTWPYLHCPITRKALSLGKHVLTEARMACNLAEARDMARAAKDHPELVTQIVPSPFGLRAGRVLLDLLESGYIGELREVVVWGTNSDFADPEAPLHWRQMKQYSGLNMLTLGILHETLIRWVPDPVRVFATADVFVKERVDPATGKAARVERPDSVHVLSTLPNGARGLYHLSGAVYHSPGFQIHLYGSDGTLCYYLSPEDRLLGGRAKDSELREINVPPEKAGGWRVESDFIEAIRGGSPPTLTDFGTGVRYMEFTEAVERSVRDRVSVDLPLDEQSG